MRLSKTISEDTLTLRIEGGLNALSAPSIAPELDAIIGDSVPVVVVDLSELTQVDSSGIAAIISLYKRLRERGRKLHVVGVQAQPARVFELLGLHRVFRVPRIALR